MRQDANGDFHPYWAYYEKPNFESNVCPSCNYTNPNDIKVIPNNGSYRDIQGHLLTGSNVVAVRKYAGPGEKVLG